VQAFYHRDYYFPLPEGHPFQMEKFPGGHAIVAREGRGITLRPAEPVTPGQLARVHTPAYLEKVRTHAWVGSERTRMGLPADPRLFARCASECGGTLQAGRAALAEGIAANLGGGTHHAAADRASGFCLFNDVAVAIRALRVEHPDLFVFVLDTDAHQGDGTHALFSTDPRVFTYSIHVGRNFPARKVPGDCDVPLERYADGPTYLDALRRTLETAFLAFEPDLVFWVAGADVHRDDRFGQLCLDREAIEARNRFVLDLVRSWQVPLAIVYGGGYNREVALTNRLHAEPVLRAGERR